MTTEQPVPVLDDVARAQSVDRKNMLRLVNELPEQCETALGIGRSFPCDPMSDKPNVILLTGTGDSRIAGDMVVELLAEETDIPILSQHGGRIPGCIGEEALVFVVDYAGKSQTAFRNYKEAVQRGARVICVTGGGKLREAAVADGVEMVRIPAGQPTRCALGYLLVPIPAIIERLGLVSGVSEQLSYAIKLMKNSRELLRFENASARNAAKQVAQSLSGKMPVILGAPGYRRAVADRWRGQIAATSKCPAISGTFPDIVDSEIAAWERRRECVGEPAFVFLTDPVDRTTDLPELMSASAGVLEEFGVTEIEMKGATVAERALYGAFLGDYVSYYLALLNEVDPFATNTVARIEERLAGVEPEAAPPA